MRDHTPGPWQKIKVNNLVFVVHCPGGYNATEPFKGHVIMNETTCPDSEANARLIAAAPDLLAACEWVQTEMGKHTRPSPIDKAIAKARGNDQL